MGATDGDRGIEAYTTAHGPRWRVAVVIPSGRPGVKGRRRSLSFTAKSDARAFRDFAKRKGAAEAVRVYDSAPDGPTVVTVAELVEARLARPAHDVKPGTVATNRKMAHRKGSFLGALGEYPVHALTPAAVQAWVDERAGQVAAKTVSNEHGLLASVMREAVQQRLIPYSPCEHTRLPRHVRRREGLVVPSPDEVWALLSHLLTHWKPFVYTLAATGMRINEATALQWRHVDLAGGVIRVEQGWHKVNGHYVLETPKSPRSIRNIDINSVDVALLAQLDRGHPQDFVFTSLEGRRLDDSRFRDRHWHPARTAAGLRHMTPHDLRHAHASTLLGQGLSIEAVSARLGHESTDTTWRLYSHMVPAMRRRYVEATEVVYGDIGRALLGGIQPGTSALGR